MNSKCGRARRGSSERGAQEGGEESGGASVGRGGQSLSGACRGQNVGGRAALSGLHPHWPAALWCDSDLAHIVYACVLSCKFIGDDVAYIRYMQKQCAPCPCLQPVRLSCCHKMN